MAQTAPTTAAAFLLQATPWVSLVIRRGSSSEVSVKIPLDDDDDDDVDVNANRNGNKVVSMTATANGAGDRTRCLVWQFRIEEFDVAFQIVENGGALQELVRYAADADASDGSAGAVHAIAAHDAVSAGGLVSPATRGGVYTFRWDNSYSIVRHKRVFYRFVVTTSRAFKAAQTAALEMQHRQAQSKATDATHVQPHLAKRLALERRLTVDEVSFEQTRAIEQLQRCVVDMVSMFMTDPDRPLHEGSIREFLLSLEAVLRNGIKEKFLRTWPEEPYFEFLLQVEHVLRDDKQLVVDVMALPPASKLQYLGWTRSRALLNLALNRNMLHYAFENLIKRRSVVENYYDSHGLLFMYSSAAQIVSYLSALNGVKFLLATYPDETFLSEIELPPNLKQCAPNDDINDGSIETKIAGTGYVFSSGQTGDPDEMKQIDQCSIVRNLLTGQDLQEITVARGQTASVPVQHLPGTRHWVALQMCATPGDIAVVFSTDRCDHEGSSGDLMEKIVVSASDGWVDLLFVSRERFLHPLVVTLDNSSAMVRARQVTYRVCAGTMSQFDGAWESCQGMAQSMSWKIASKEGAERCQTYMEGLHFQQQQDVAEQQQRETSGSNDMDNDTAVREDDSLFGMGASLIAKPVSYLVGGFLGLDGDTSAAACAQCIAPFTFFSRQFTCPINGKGVQVKVCDRCFIKEMDAEKKRRAATANGSATGGECAAYATLREDATMEKYFKMLSFGVPHSGVAQKMLQDEMPSNKIVAFSAGPSGATEEESGGRNTKRRDSDSKTRGSGSQRGSSFRKVHWKSLETERATASIWNRETSRRKTAPIRLSSHDFHEIAQLFSRDSAAGGDDAKLESSGGVKKKQVFSALDSRRSNNISIGLSQFKAVGGAEAILRSLKNCDFEFLSSDRLSNIYEIAPSSVEAKRYSNFRGSRSRLEPAEKFLVDMCDISRVTEKIAAMRFAAQFESQHRELCHRVKAITDACYQILQSERLARCFELVLAIGNLLNSGTEIENAGGVTLESLLKLSETKSIDQSITLLHFIARLIHDRGEGDVLMFVQELSGISEAKRFSNVICLSQANALQSGVSQAENEVKEEVLMDVKAFEKAEDVRRQKHNQPSRVASTRQRVVVVAANGSTSVENPRAVLMEMLHKRGQSVEGGFKPPKPPSLVQIASGAQVTSLESSPVTTPQPQQQSEEQNRDDSSARPASMTEVPPRNALLAAIRQRSVKKAEFSDETALPEHPRMASMDALELKTSTSAVVSPDLSSQANVAHSRPPLDIRPPRANILSAIRARGLPTCDNHSQVQPPSDIKKSPSQSNFKPRAYSVDDNAFITNMRRRLLDIKVAMEQLDLQVETMVSVWESTARYLGEDPQSSTSEYVLQLLNRFILDVKIAKSVLSRQGLSFQSIRSTAQVGSVVATKFGPGVVTAIRGDTKLEVLYPWSREAYLSPSSILSVGAVVSCRKFGVGIVRSTHYDRGFCRVRFSFGFGVIRVHDISPVATSAGQSLKRKILADSFRVGDPVITPFGCGSVRSISRNFAQDNRGNGKGYYGYVAVTVGSEEDGEQHSSPGAFVQLDHVHMNY